MCCVRSHRFCNRCDWRTRFAATNEYITLIISNDFFAIINSRRAAVPNSCRQFVNVKKHIMPERSIATVRTIPHIKNSREDIVLHFANCLPDLYYNLFNLLTIFSTLTGRTATSTGTIRVCLLTYRKSK
jgi:hypothetical protein